MDVMTVVHGGTREGWTELVDPPGEIPSAGREITAYTSADGAFTCGFWEREPDTWTFERPYDEVAFIVSGTADVETDDGRVLALGPGDVLVTPIGSKGTWRISAPIVKFFAIYEGRTIGVSGARLIKEGDPVEWIVLETSPDDPTPPGEEWYAFKSPDARFSTGVWRREPETGPMDMTYDEVAVLIEGEVDLELPDGRVISAGPGDAIVSPAGSKATWKARSAVRKFWAVHHVS